MLGWIKKKTDTPAPQAPAKAAPPAPGSPLPKEAPKESPEVLAQWQARLAAAAGDDPALLDMARLAPTVALKCAAVEALADEAALKLAEREFRDHDRRVHRIAKQRHDAAVARRVAREKAAGLIDAATALLDETTIPTNRLVELDKAWQALGPALLDDPQRARFAELSARLTELTTERAERELQARRWLAATQQALVRVNSAGAQAGAELAEPAEPAEPAELAGAIADARGLLADVPAGAAASTSAGRLQEAIEQALQQAAQAEARREARLEAMRSLPPEPLSPPAAPIPPAADTASRKAEAKAAQRDRAQAVAPLLEQAEAALASGNLADTQRLLSRIDSVVDAGSLPDALRARLNTLHAEFVRLKGWQSWGGGRARDDLVQEAQTLATATAAALADPAQSAKLPVKQLADAIDDLRKRWKELDRLGGATNQSLWHAFDAALKTCFEPVGAHLDQLKAKRKENLAARQQLLTALEASLPPPLGESGVGGLAPQPGDPAAPHPGPLPIGAREEESGSTDWKEQARALSHFQTEWRKLGPVEHTVPHKARDALMARMQASVARIEAPLHEARRSAQQGREQLVARANALRDEAAASPHSLQSRDLPGRVRELQEQWQQHARSLPLTRQVENALWAEFKAATDAVFAQRDAAFNARDAELLANQAGREALIARLEALTPDTPAAEFKRTLAEVDAEWRQPVDVPRQQVAPLDARFHRARQAAQSLLAGSAQRIRQARFDALLAKLALCEQREALADAAAPNAVPGVPGVPGVPDVPDEPAAPDDLAARWAAAATLQPAWDQALVSRWQQAGAPAADADAHRSALDSVLLQLEAALNLVSPADLQAARRDMKLRAMKAALEGRNTTPPPSVEALTQTALRHARPSSQQSERLHAIIAALRTHESATP